MQRQNSIRILIVFAIIFAFLFHRKTLGLNLVLFETLILSWLFYSQQLTLKTFNERLLTGALVLTLTFTIRHHSTWSYLIHFAVFLLFVGGMIAPRMRSLVNVLGMALSNIFLSFHELFQEKETSQSQKISRRSIQLKRLVFYIIPLAIIVSFASLYGFANPDFGAYVDVLFGKLFEAIRYFFVNVDFMWLFTFIFGFVLCVFILMRRKNKVLEERDAAALDEKLRVRNSHPGSSIMRLKNEYRAGIFLFGALNILLLLMNLMDIDKVWLHFNFEGQYLKQFVHHGTIVLIIAVLLSIVLVLVFFRGNLNFYQKGVWLKRLCYIWLGQNAILAISAGIRNLYYIQYYSLAYKRIAIIFFLLLVLYGLYSVYIKVRDTRSTFYMVRKNAVVWVIVLCISAGFNWDRIIAKYNFSREDGAFVHLNFLSELSDTALPYLDQPLEKVTSIDAKQMGWIQAFSSSSRKSYYNVYMTPAKYEMEIEYRKMAFQIQWKKKSWLEWNYAEWDTYQLLQED